MNLKAGAASPALPIPLAPDMREQHVGDVPLHAVTDLNGGYPLVSLDGGEPLSSEHLFRNASLTLLRGCPYENTIEADKAFIRFTNDGCSTMHLKEAFVPKRHDNKFAKTAIYRCGAKKQCPLRVNMRVFQNGSVTFELCATGAAQLLSCATDVPAHVGHELQRPIRATCLVQQFARRLEREVREDGRSGSDLTNVVIGKAAAIGIDLTANSVNAIRRQLCMEKLTSRILNRCPMESLFKLGETIIDISSTSESSLHASAVLGILVSLQKQQPDAYIRVAVVGGCLQYACFATLQMRLFKKVIINLHVMFIFHITIFGLEFNSDHLSTNYGGHFSSIVLITGSLYGDMRTLDDKHGVSSNAYHVAACTVQTNHTSQPAMLAIFARSDGSLWHQFAEDCHEAFVTSKGDAGRPLQFTIADGDGQIDSSISATNSTATRLSCWFHWQAYVRKHYLSSESQWKPVHNVIDTLLDCDEKLKCARLLLEWYY